MVQSSSASSSNPFPPLPFFNPARFRSYILRLPLFTRACVVAILFFWALELQTVWSVTKWGSLIPSEIGFKSSKLCSWVFTWKRRGENRRVGQERFRTCADSVWGIVYRLNTFPFIHLGFIHMAIDTICFVPLLERFEAEHGTLSTLALFLGRESLHSSILCKGWWNCSPDTRSLQLYGS